MEIEKSLKKNSAALAKAKQEFEAFKSSRKALILPASSSCRMAAGAPSPTDRLLYCSSHHGACSRLILELKADKAAIIDVIKMARLPNMSGPSIAPEDQSLLTHYLSLGKFKACPHCGNDSIAYCEKCKTLSCLGPDERGHRCPVCGNTAPVDNTGIRLGFSSAKPAPGKALPGRLALIHPSGEG